MADRFEKLFALPNNLYTTNSPVIIAVSSLLKDTQTGRVIVQLKFQSVAYTSIKALKIGISAYDVTDKAIEGVDEYQYLDLKVEHGQEFGANKAIILPSEITRRFSISGIEVVFGDNSTWVWDNRGELLPLPKQNPLNSILKDQDLESQYRYVTNSQARYVPIEYGALWACSCGKWNGHSMCSHCCGSKQRMITSLNVEELQIGLQSRIQATKEAEEYARKQAEVEQKRASEERKANTKQSIKVISIAVAIVVILVIAASILSSVINKQKAIEHYNMTIEQIEESINNKRWETAFDLVAGNDIEEPKKQEYLDVILPNMKEQFVQKHSNDVELVGDGFIVEIQGKTIYLTQNGERVEIYKAPDDNKGYTDGEWTSGYRYWLKEDCMYADGDILFVEYRDQIVPHATLDWWIEITIKVKAYNIETGSCRTILSDAGSVEFIKLVDGRIILDSNGAIYNPYTGELSQESNILNEEFDVIYRSE